MGGREGGGRQRGGLTFLSPNPTGCPTEGTRRHEHAWPIKHRDAPD